MSRLRGKIEPSHHQGSLNRFGELRRCYVAETRHDFHTNWIMVVGTIEVSGGFHRYGMNGKLQIGKFSDSGMEIIKKVIEYLIPLRIQFLQHPRDVATAQNSIIIKTSSSSESLTI